MKYSVILITQDINETGDWTFILTFADQCLKESTKAAAPAFTFAGKYEQKVKSVAPSPNTYNTAGLTAKGK